MNFDYNEYYMGCLWLPISVLFFWILGLTPAVIKLITYVIKYHTMPQISPQKWVAIIMVLAIFSFFICLDGGRLINGGIYLISEKESDALSTIGTIDNIELMTRYEFGELNSEYKVNEHNGVCFTIDGIQYRAIAMGTLEIGDKVEVTYLPKSSYILKIHRIEKTRDGTLP